MQVTAYVGRSRQAVEVVFLQRLDRANGQIHLPGDLRLTETRLAACISQHRANGLLALLGVLLHYDVFITLLRPFGTR